MKKLRKYVSTMIVILSGLTVSSLWITHSDNWETYLPIWLVLVSFLNYLNEYIDDGKKSKITVEDLNNLKMRNGQSSQQIIDMINYHEEQIQSIMGIPSRLCMHDEVGQAEITGKHANLIISDMPPTKWQKFIHKLNPFASKEKKRVFKSFENSIK